MGKITFYWKINGEDPCDECGNVLMKTIHIDRKHIINERMRRLTPFTLSDRPLCKDCWNRACKMIGGTHTYLTTKYKTRRKG